MDSLVKKCFHGISTSHHIVERNSIHFHSSLKNDKLECNNFRLLELRALVIILYKYSDNPEFINVR